ncbi:MAG: response regulator transcription factor [Bacteroidales bacterium]|nr:response regulator transcription factor [Bacteroidales bacterium]
MSPLISILIVEPSTIIVEGIKVLLDEAGGFNVLAPLHDTSMLTERITSQRPDIVLLNPTLVQHCQQPSAVQRIAQSRPVVALLYQYTGPQALQGYSAVLDIRENRSRVAALLRECCDRYDNECSTEDYELTERETEVLVLLAQGLSSKAIADRLNISIHTVNTHRKNITNKTGIKSVAGLAVYATLHNFIDG